MADFEGILPQLAPDAVHASDVVIGVGPNAEVKDESGKVIGTLDSAAVDPDGNIVVTGTITDDRVAAGMRASLEGVSFTDG